MSWLVPRVSLFVRKVWLSGSYLCLHISGKQQTKQGLPAAVYGEHISLITSSSTRTSNCVWRRICPDNVNWKLCGGLSKSYQALFLRVGFKENFNDNVHYIRTSLNYATYTYCWHYSVNSAFYLTQKLLIVQIKRDCQQQQQQQQQQHATLHDTFTTHTWPHIKYRVFQEK